MSDELYQERERQTLANIKASDELVKKEAEPRKEGEFERIKANFRLQEAQRRERRSRKRNDPFGFYTEEY